MIKILILDLILAHLAQIRAPKTFLLVLPVRDAMHCCKLSLYAISRNINETNLRKRQKELLLGQILAYFGLNLVSKNSFLWVLPLLAVIHCCNLSLYAISRNTNRLNLRKWQKTQFCTLWPKFAPSKFFHGFYHYQMLDIVASYHCM